MGLGSLKSIQESDAGRSLPGSPYKSRDPPAQPARQDCTQPCALQPFRRVLHRNHSVVSLAVSQPRASQPCLRSYAAQVFTSIGQLELPYHPGPSKHAPHGTNCCSPPNPSQVFTSIGQLELFYDQAPDVMRSCSMALVLLSVCIGSYLSGENSCCNCVGAAVSS